ncbi:MAG: pyridoxamine 5'-phosphate oxidase family protein [Acidimicrobiaceae bacterium]|nr:pyridoxamine 5'-phosphate oxidase family protein [Acidimicrobiaceae bacterium]
MVDSAVTWAGFEQADGELAQRVMARLGSHRHAIMATLKADGSPRTSGMEAPIRSGHLWLAMAPGSRKAGDLGRDPRFTLHSAPDAELLPEGDARVDGMAQPADTAQQAEFVAGHRYPIDDPSTMALYVAMITRVVLVRVSGDSLLIESWSPATGRDTHRIQ